MYAPSSWSGHLFNHCFFVSQVFQPSAAARPVISFAGLVKVKVRFIALEYCRSRRDLETPSFHSFITLYK